MVGTKLTSRGQTTIPKHIRERLGLEAGDRVLFLVKDGEVVLQPVNQGLRDLRGSVKPQRKPEDFDEVRREVRRRVAERNLNG